MAILADVNPSLACADLELLRTLKLFILVTAGEYNQTGHSQCFLIARFCWHVRIARTAAVPTLYAAQWDDKMSLASVSRLDRNFTQKAQGTLLDSLHVVTRLYSFYLSTENDTFILDILLQYNASRTARHDWV